MVYTLMLLFILGLGLRMHACMHVYFHRFDNAYVITSYCLRCTQVPNVRAPQNILKFKILI